MTLISRKEFYQVAYLQATAYPRYKDLGKFIVTVGDDGKDWIDMSDPINIDFVKERVEKYSNPNIEQVREQKKKEKQQQKEKAIQEKQQAEVQRIEHVKEKVQEQIESSGDSVYDLEKKIKLAQLEKIQEETLKTKFTNEKLRGNYIPTDIVKSLFAQHNMSLMQSFNNAAVDLVTTIAQRKQFTNDEVADLKGFLKKTINFSIDDAAESTMKHLKKIIADYAEKK